MIDITSSKLLILGIVALLVIGPKDLPALLRTIGKYMGIIKRHAADFRAQFDDAMRESELAELKKEVEKVGSEAEATMRAAEHSVDQEISAARQDVEGVMVDEPKPAVTADTFAHDANLLPAPGTESTAGAQPVLNGSGQEPGHATGHASDTAPAEPAKPETASSQAAQAADTKTGV
jgi:sec-independent protein translocase protein TatB